MASDKTGDTRTILPGGSWPCAPVVSSMPKLMKLRAQMMDPDVPDSIMKRLHFALQESNAIMVGTKQHVTVLSTGPKFVRVRIIPKTTSKTLPAAYSGCWIDPAAFVR